MCSRDLFAQKELYFFFNAPTCTFTVSEVCVCIHAGFASSSWAPTAVWQNCPARPSCTPSKPSALRWSRKRRLRPWPRARWSVRSSRRNWRYSERKGENQKSHIASLSAFSTVSPHQYNWKRHRNSLSAFACNVGLQSRSVSVLLM